jgi:hypothetical protein
MDERERMSEGGERKWKVKLTRVKGVKFVMCIAHDLNTCHVMNGWFGARAATQVVGKFCPKIYDF